MTTLPNHGAAGTGSRLRPYLTTAQLISLCVLAAPLVSLIFVLFRLQASSDVAQQSVTQAKATLQASCLAAEHAATVGASLPRYLAQGVNDEITKSVRATMNGVRIGLTLSLTAVEALIEFIIDMYRSTFLCLLELVIRGGLAVVISAVSEITSFINTTLSSISSSIAGDVSTANSVIQTAVNLVKKIPLVGDNINIPQFTVPSAAQLSSIQIPTTFEDSLRTLNSSIPTLDELRQQLDNLISVPFQLLTKEINDTFAAAEANFTLTPLPVPQQATVSFCDDTLSSSFDNLARDLLKVAEIGFFIIIGCMVLVFFAYAFLTWYSQRSLRQNIERIRHLWFGDGTATTDRLMAFDALISHPIWSRIVKFLAEKFRISQEKYDALTWFGLYVFHPAPLACLLIGIFGILSVQLQLLIIRPLQEHYSTEVANNIQDLTGTIATKLNSTMWEESGAYAVALNEKISGVQTAINTDLFGWVNATIVPLNNTLASFYQEVQDTVNTLLGGTPFDSPAQEFIRCILGSKVVGIEHALTFLQQNLQVDLPQVNTSALVLSQANVNEVAAPISAAAVGSSDNGQDGGVIGKIIGAYISSLEKERITFFLFLLLWALAVFVALLVIAWHFWVVPALHKRGMKEPRWLAGPSWEDSMVYKSDPSQVEKYQLHNLKAGDAAMVSPIPSPLRKNADAASTSHTMVGDSDSLRQRRPGENKASGDMSSFLPGDEQPRPSLFAKIGGFISKRRGNHTAKRSSDSSILPIAKNVEPEPKAAEEEPSYEWFERLTFWKRGVVPAEEDVLTPPRGVSIPHDRTASQDSGFDYDVPPPRHPATRPRSNEGRPRPDLRVDVAKATATSNQPRIVIENPGYSIEPTVVIAPSRPKAPSRQGSEGSNRDYLAVPSRSQPKRVHEPKPPAWVAAIKNKQGLPATPGESPDRSSPPTRPRENQGSRPSRSNSLPKRPPGLPMKTEERGRQPSVPKPAVTVDSHDRSRHEKKRRSSVPPGASRNRTDSSQGQQRNKSLTRSSSLDDVDPFATPRSMVKPLPLPLEPVKLAPPANQASTSTAHIVPSIMVTKPSVSSINPFITPFDDSYAVYTKGTGAGAPTNGAGYNFSMPNRRQDGAI